MTKEELKNRVLNGGRGSGNSRLLSQAAAATKRVVALEEENNKLLDVINNQDVKIADLEKRIEQIIDTKCTSCTTLGGMQLKIDDLEKENAELKKELAFRRYAD